MPKRWSKQRRLWTGLAVGVGLTVLFYAEENWRGKRAWENCKRAIRAGGIALDWTNYISAEIPSSENVFGVPEMQRWFGVPSAEAAWKDLTRNLSSSLYPGATIDSNTPRMLVAEVRIGQPGTSPPEGFAALRWDDPAARAQAAQLLTNAIGPIARSPQSLIGAGRVWEIFRPTITTDAVQSRLRTGTWKSINGSTLELNRLCSGFIRT